jgi:hypothetical protein
VIDPAIAHTTLRIEAGFFSDEKKTAAARAVRPPQAWGGKNPCRRNPCRRDIYRTDLCRKSRRRSLAGGLDGHRRSLLGANRRSSPAPYATDSARALWRHRDGQVKLSWRRGPIHRKSDPLAVSGIGCRSARNWSGRTSGNPPFCRRHRAHAPTPSRGRREERPRPAPSSDRAGSDFACHFPPYHRLGHASAHGVCRRIESQT